MKLRMPAIPLITVDPYFSVWSRDEINRVTPEHWVACMADDPADFADLTHRLWLSYHVTHDRVPLTDWYYADTTHQRWFRHRTVMGGLFLKLLFE